MTELCKPPQKDQIEITLLGPGYGESIVLHVGQNRWIVIDSCISSGGEPEPLRYLDRIGVDSSRDVRLVVATHWHDDHIRGMGQIVETCQSADFCHAATLLKEEFLSYVYANEGNSIVGASSGVREIHNVFSQLSSNSQKKYPRGAIPALANTRVYNQSDCEVWSLSPSSTVFQEFLLRVGSLMPIEGQTKRRQPAFSANHVAVALWVSSGDVSLLLGSDLEKPGWGRVVQSSARPQDKASVYKVAHHGSKNADLPEVWSSMLVPDPWAVLTPWRRGGRELPTESDVRRILSYTNNAYATAKTNQIQSSAKIRNQAVRKTVREAGIRIRDLNLRPGAVRLRKSKAQADWTLEMFGSAYHLKN